MSDLIPKINSAIKYSFYFLFFLVPLIMWPTTFELFEFNKMWLVFLTSVFIFFLWGTKMVLQGKFEIRRTPLDIPIALFLVSQIISTIFSMDSHVSLWGYYSRFNGGLLSTIAYIFLYYAFASNLIPDERDENSKPISYKVLFVSLLSGLAVTLWGLPSHFGFDPTCFMFRGELNTSCWTDQFQPTVRIFSTLGQPNWMGTFLAILIPIAVGFGLASLKTAKRIFAFSFFVLAALSYIGLLWTRSQSSFLGLVIGMAIFAIVYLLNQTNIKQDFKKTAKEIAARSLLILILIFAVITFFIGTPISSVNKLITLEAFTQGAKSETPEATEESFTANPTITIGGSESSDIRLIVWEGAIELFKRNPLFGTGVETFAYAYYNVKPLSHNLTSEWDFLYNKAHNEYLNYAATTGAFGLLTYLALLGYFLFIAAKTFLKTKNSDVRPITIGIVAGLVALYISNFFGFSVVILNLLLFLLPLFFFELEKSKGLNKTFSFGNGNAPKDEKIGTGAMMLISVVGIISLLAALHLINFWFADKSYALGYNLNKASEFVQANEYLAKAVEKLPNEDLYKDELSINLATLAVLLAQQNQATQAAELGRQAKELSDEITTRHPNNVVYLKTRARVAFALAQIDPSFLALAIKTVEDAKKIAPTDAKLSYNLALFYNQQGDQENTIKYMNEAIKLKPNYIDPYYALGLFYSQLAEEDATRAAEYRAEARKNLEYILKNLDPNHDASRELLETL